MDKEHVEKLVKTSLMLALALVFQIGFASFSQVVVGPLVNMVLFITVMMVSPLSAIFVGVLTPLVAFFVGIVNIFPLVPMIAIGNCILVLAFSQSEILLKNKVPSLVSVVVASLLKFVFLALAVRYLLPFFIPKVPKVLITVLSFNQFLTALTGGALALVIVNILKKVRKNR